VSGNDTKMIAAKLAAVSDHLNREAGSPVPDGVLPLSVDDVERAGQWMAGESASARTSLNDEPDVCRQTLSRIRALQQYPAPDKKQAASDKKQESP
ncbi:MAG: hypothetical protein J0I90_10190, partial [Nitrosospira sp.]|nr:hypothetical protein [Nitrosospira sp.]